MILIDKVMPFVMTNDWVYIGIFMRMFRVGISLNTECVPLILAVFQGDYIITQNKRLAG